MKSNLKVRVKKASLALAALKSWSEPGDRCLNNLIGHGFRALVFAL
jgi:hypothetical protein